jgi:DNA polymerase-3 subunit delta'
MSPRRSADPPVEAGAAPWDGPIWDHIRFQEEALAAMREPLAAERLPHSLLLWGPPGVGKLRSAQGLAQALLCTDAAPPCGRCPACGKAARFIHPDLHVLRPMKSKEDPSDDPLLASYVGERFASLEAVPPAGVGIDRIRAVKLEASKSLVEGRCRVLIVSQADLMTQEAANAALKIMEEPRGETFLILTVADPRRLLPTVVSRCRRIRFRALPADYMEKVTVEETGAAAEAARLAVALAEGSLPRAIQWAREDIVGRRDEFLELVAPAGGDTARVMRRAETWGRRFDAEAARFFAGLLGLWQQDLLRCHSGSSEKGIIHRDCLDRLRREAAGVSVTEIRRRLELIEELVEAVTHYVNPQLSLKSFLVAWERGDMPDRMQRPVQ